MIEGTEYIKTAKIYYDFLSSEYNFIVHKEVIQGNYFYDLQYKDDTRIISISYENIEDYFLVIIYILDNGLLPDYDDKTRTLNLSKIGIDLGLNMLNVDNSYRHQYPSTKKAENVLEKKMIANAKKLYKYLHSGMPEKEGMNQPNKSL